MRTQSSSFSRQWFAPMSWAMTLLLSLPLLLAGSGQALGMSQRPDFRETYKSVENRSRTADMAWPGDRLRYTITTTNTGDDVSRDTKLTDRLPAQLQYVPGTMMLNDRSVTDQPGDDVAWFNDATRTLTLYLGRDATPTQGGKMAIGESVTFTFEACR
ncbi:DUF11 domain-containing protein [Archangium violaceum]|uniref:DUF11 domain-containing protein n=1 Tax=Archangium violaceum TaxID=83451 RepID=UPI00193BA36E|nr:DUF11 domain-containing protein [Archangium violaceum]QRK11262.1 DUF11 domain-containing protein [Archangium violaceum]